MVGAWSASSRAAGEMHIFEVPGGRHPSLCPRGPVSCGLLLEHRSLRGAAGPAVLTRTRSKSKTLLVAVCPPCLFIRFQTATVLHLGSLLRSACCKHQVTREFSVHARICSSSVAETAPLTACELPASREHRSPLQPSTGQLSFCCKTHPPPAFHLGYLRHLPPPLMV